MVFNSKSPDRQIAYFISPHGYGHAARSSAVMEAVHDLDPTVRFEIFTQVPRWFFEDSLHRPFGYHSLLTDIGLVQKSPLVEDLPETVKRLDQLLPFDASQIKDLAELVKQLGCQLILCDIAPMGIAVGREAGIPSVLVENFTWDWIYEEYAKYDARLGRYVTYLGELFDAADYRIQVEPVCQHLDADLTTLPVSRKIRSPRQQIRHRLGLPDQAKAVMITLGGVPWKYTFLEQQASQSNTYFIIPGGTDEQKQIHDNLVLLPHHSDFFHPDLVNASDAVIGKAGYSTVAEVYYAGVPFGYLHRPRFRESQFLTGFAKQHMNGLPISETQFQNGDWLSIAADLLALPRIGHRDARGAQQVARFLFELLDGRN